MGGLEDHCDSLNCFKVGISIALAGKQNTFSQLPIPKSNCSTDLAISPQEA